MKIYNIIINWYLCLFIFIAVASTEVSASPCYSDGGVFIQNNTGTSMVIRYHFGTNAYESLLENQKKMNICWYSGQGQKAQSLTALSFESAGSSRTANERLNCKVFASKASWNVAMGSIMCGDELRENKMLLLGKHPCIGNGAIKLPDCHLVFAGKVSAPDL